MEERIRKLKEKGYFQKVEIDDKGFGTFRVPCKMRDNDFLNKARSIKREADLKKSIELYIEAMLNYIKGYRNEELKIGKDKVIGYYKGLYKYTTEIYKMIDEASKYKHFVFQAMFAIKFHILNLESKVQEFEFRKSVHEIYGLFKKNKDCPKIDELENIFHKTNK